MLPRLCCVMEDESLNFVSQISVVNVERWCGILCGDTRWIKS